MITKSYNVNIYKKIGERVNSLSFPETSNYFINSSKQYNILYSDIYDKYLSQIFYEKSSDTVLELSTNTLGILLSNVKDESGTYMYYHITDVELLDSYIEYVNTDYLLVGTTLYHNNPNFCITINGTEYFSSPVFDLDLHLFKNYQNISIVRNKDNFKILISKESSESYKYKLKSKYLFHFHQINNFLSISENIYTPVNTHGIENISEYCLKDTFSMSKLKYPVLSIDSAGESDLHTYNTIRSNLIFNFPFETYVYIDLSDKINPLKVSIKQLENSVLLAIVSPFFKVTETIKNPYYNNKEYSLDYNSFKYSLDSINDDSLFFKNKFKCADIRLNINDVITDRKFYVGIKLNKVIYHQNKISNYPGYSTVVNTQEEYDMLDEILQEYPYAHDTVKYYTYKHIEDELDG